MPCHTTSSYHSDTFFSLIALTLQLVFGRWHRGLGVLGYSSWWGLSFVVVVYRHAGQPRDSSSSMYICSAMVVISFLSILGNSRLIRRSSCPSSFVTWYSSVRVLILSLFIICSSRFSLYTSQLSWQGMTGEFGVACRVFCCVTVFLGRILVCGH